MPGSNGRRTDCIRYSLIKVKEEKKKLIINLDTFVSTYKNPVIQNTDVHASWPYEIDCSQQWMISCDLQPLPKEIKSPSYDVSWYSQQLPAQFG